MFHVSSFGEKFGKVTGIGELMNDIGDALQKPGEAILMGGGNPAVIKEMHDVFYSLLNENSDSDKFSKLISSYDSPQGNEDFLQETAKYFQRTFGWNITRNNIAITNGSQNAFFYLLNMFSGTFADGTKKRILFPMVPEYIGYADQTLNDDALRSYLPKVEYTGKHSFKYRVDFDALKIDDSIGAICVTRPTNPTGNVITDEEMQKLSQLAKENNIPLIVDNAYGQPFPGILFCETETLFDKHIIHSFSLSKLGLPSLRTGIIVADEEIINMISNMNAVINLASGTFGQVLTTKFIAQDKITHLSKTVITPFYKKRSDEALELIERYFPDDLPYYVHKNEGAFFLWLWLKNLPVSNYELYRRLKARNVYIIPGCYFFAGCEEDSAMKNECIRITFSQSREILEKGIRILAEEVTKLYNGE
jgi:valine--pyruvate aminotransferase